ncbi:MAG TPA: FliH/SctL family protein [Gaiellaceae bacterium]|jgi:flagellar assembly protein FliH
MPAATESYRFPELDGWRVDRDVPPPFRTAAAADLDPVAEAERRGHDEGLAAGRALAEAELEPLRAALVAATSALGGARNEAIGVVEARAVELGVMLAGKILATALEVDPHQVLTVVEGALRHLVDKDEVVLEVNPADVTLLQTEIERLDASSGGPRSIAVVGERRVSRGGCIVRTREGEIDARIETQLERAAELLHKSLSTA